MKKLLMLFAVFILSYDVMDSKFEPCKGTQAVVVTTSPYSVQQVICQVSLVKSIKEEYKSREVAEAIAQKVKSMGAVNVYVQKK